MSQQMFFHVAAIVKPKCFPCSQGYVLQQNLLRRCYRIFTKLTACIMTRTLDITGYTRNRLRLLSQKYSIYAELQVNCQCEYKIAGVAAALKLQFVHGFW